MKNLGVLDDEGMAIVGDPVLAEALREMREYGWREHYVSACVGIDSIQAAILGVKLESLTAGNHRRPL
jgi:hypothetical protein